MGMRRGMRGTLKEGRTRLFEYFERRDRVEDMEEQAANRPEFAHVRIERIGKSQGARVEYVGIRVFSGGQDMGPFYTRLDRINPVNQGPKKR